MKAIVRDRYGPPEVVELREVDKPVPADDEVLVRVRAASLNALDWYTLTGTPWIARPMTGLRGPKDNRLGVDYAGKDEAVGKDVTEFRPDDEVFGGKDGALAEYHCIRAEKGVLAKPANLTFEQAATVPVAALTALQGLRDKGGVRPGHKVLINGASGGVGTFAVQIAKALGAEVTAVCSTGNVETARSLGADHVVDYTNEDFTRSGRRYDVLLDVAGSRSWSAYKRVLEPEGKVVIVGGPKSRLLGPLGHIAQVLLASRLSKQKAVFFVAKLEKADLAVLRDLLQADVTPVIDRQYELRETAEALRYLGKGHAKSKIVITV
jgi:NADPH:quinone reductase-like Zn-dependent oxidoreductase